MKETSKPLILIQAALERKQNDKGPQPLPVEKASVTIKDSRLPSQKDLGSNLQSVVYQLLNFSEIRFLSCIKWE